MKNTLNWVAARWLKLAGYAVVSLAILGFLTLRLGNIVPSRSLSEQAAIHNSSSMHKIIDNPLYVSHKLGQYSVQKVFKPTNLKMRAVSVVFGIMALFVMYMFLRVWRTERVATFGVILLASSSWFLHLSRLATPFISTSLFVISLALWMACVVYSKDRPKLVLLSGAVLAVLSLYQPGLIWLGLGFIVWQFRNLLLLFKRARWPYVSLAVCIGLVGVAPLVYALVRNHHLVYQWLLIPEHLPAVKDMLKAVAQVPLSLFWSSTSDPVYGLGTLPLLDVFSVVMFIIGMYQWKLRLGWLHTILAVIMFLGAIWLLAVNDRATYMMIALPIVYVTIAAGVTLLLQQWFTVFPRNPLARNVGIAILASVIGITAYYHLNRYFVAWPNAPETKAVFSIQAASK